LNGQRFIDYSHIESLGPIGADTVGTGEQVTKCPGAWVPGCLGAWVPGCLGAWVPGCLGAWVLNVEVSCTLLDKIFHNLRI